MTQYISKSAIVAEIERRLDKLANTSTEGNMGFAAVIGAQHYELFSLVQYINTLEVKEELANLFPELKESEDERIKTFIRGLLLPHIADVHIEGDKLVHNKDIDNYRKALAWLEKQGNRDTDDCHVDLSGCSEEYRKAYYDGWNACNRRYEREWSEEDRKMMRNIIDDIHCGTNFNPEVMSEANKRIIANCQNPEIKRLK